MAIAGIAAIASIAGTAASVFGSFLSYQGEEKANAARKAQVDLEAQRQTRNQIRQAQVARANAVATATTQGAGQSSALQGGIAQVTNQGYRNIVSINQDRDLAGRVFAGNSQIAQGGMISSLGAGVSSLGGAVANVSGVVTR